MVLSSVDIYTTWLAFCFLITEFDINGWSCRRGIFKNIDNSFEIKCEHFLNVFFICVWSDYEPFYVIIFKYLLPKELIRIYGTFLLNCTSESWIALLPRTTTRASDICVQIFVNSLKLRFRILHLCHAATTKSFWILTTVAYGQKAVKRGNRWSFSVWKFKSYTCQHHE